MKITKIFKTLAMSMVVALAFVGCNNNMVEDVSKSEAEEYNILLGDEIIYGDTFSLSDFFETQARSANLSDDELVEMVYFSVCPTTVNSVLVVNDAFGYLNPMEMNREIIQACDAESVIFYNDVEITEETSAEELIKLGVKLYYIEIKEKVNELKDILEGFEVIEEFSMPVEDKCEMDASRGIFDSYEIKGNVTYSLDGTKVPANGITMKRGSHTSVTDANGNFSLGSSKNIYGLCWIWAYYYNSACVVTNILNIVAPTLLAVTWPSKLSNVKLSATTNYASGKMAICGDCLYRYNDEEERHSNIPKVLIWTTEVGDGTSSAPCFNFTNGNLFPDIFLTNWDSNSKKSLQTFHQL